METLMLYIHIPFCERKCNYCDFLSATSTKQQRQEYVETLCNEIKMHRKRGAKSKISSIFFGGGTPSILSVDQITQIMKTIQFTFPHIEERAEITIELNPGSADINKLQTYLDLGINRLSIGLQATNNQELEILGRIHTYEIFLETYHQARKLGFSNINIDLMSALPGQTLESWKDTLHKIIALNPEHISAYSLIVEEGTPFYKDYCEEGMKFHMLPLEEDERNMYYQTQQLLKSGGYHRYEISNYAKDGFQCKHNLGYWDRTPYMGLGLGASSLLVDDIEGEVRTTNISDYQEYMEQILEQKSPHEVIETLTIETAMEEYVFLGLRNIKGISIKEFQKQFNQEIEVVYKKEIEECLKNHLLKKEGHNLKLTSKGIDLSNVVLSKFV